MTGLGLVDPSDRQLMDWAYSPEMFESNGQDFELYIASLDRSRIILQLAADDSCPTQSFFFGAHI